MIAMMRGSVTCRMTNFKKVTNANVEVIMCWCSVKTQLLKVRLEYIKCTHQGTICGTSAQNLCESGLDAGCLVKDM